MSKIIYAQLYYLLKKVKTSVSDSVPSSSLMKVSCLFQCLIQGFFLDNRKYKNSQVSS